MPRGVRLLVSGEMACFTRPEFTVERVSYDVITPTAARGILESIYWKPDIRWQANAIHVLKPIKFISVLRNEVGQKVAAGTVRRAMHASRDGNLSLIIENDRQQRNSSILTNVSYLIEATFELKDLVPEGHSARHLAAFTRRASRGQVFQQPYLGNREFPARFRLLQHREPMPQAIDVSQQLGLMLLDIDYENGHAPIFFEARLESGVLRMPGSR